MSGYKKLWYGGYGKYNYYVVADGKEKALEELKSKYNLRALPIDCREIDNVDGHIIIAVSEEELKEHEEVKESYVSKTKPIDEMSRNELIQLAKELRIEGKIATFKTEKLRGKVGDKLEAITEESGRSE